MGAYIGVRGGVGVNSGTDAIYIALAAAGVGAGDEVITVPNTAVPTVSAIQILGARPVFVDIRDDDFDGRQPGRRGCYTAHPRDRSGTSVRPVRRSRPRSRAGRSRPSSPSAPRTSGRRRSARRSPSSRAARPPAPTSSSRSRSSRPRTDGSSRSRSPSSATVPTRARTPRWPSCCALSGHGGPHFRG